MFSVYWFFAPNRSSTRDLTIKAVRGTAAIKGIFDNQKGLGSCYGGGHSPYGAIGPLTGGSVPITGLFQFSADCKRGRRRSKNVKDRQKVSKSFFDTFRQFSHRAKNVKNRQKMSKSFSALFNNFRAAPFFWPVLGGSEILSLSIKRLEPLIVRVLGCL